MGYLSCRADSSISTCRSISSIVPSSKKQPSPKPKQDDEEEEDDGGGGVIRHFSYSELEAATGSFSDSSLLGRGSHGSVYRAVLRRAGPVAVKRPSRRHHDLRSTAELDNEILILSSLRSPRLVNLLGFTTNPISSSSSSRERLLVVELMPNGTLYDLLHTRPRPPSWHRRLRLALQTSKALHTLHSSSPPVIHRDVKSANILIDADFNARLGDFGLALRLGGPDDAFSSACKSTPPAGTLGYLDPCYVTPEDLSTKTDVFSFGILLFEIISGRKAIDVAHSPPSVLEWAVPLLKKGKVSALYDPRVPPLKDSAVRRQLALLAAGCVRSSDERRPAMEEVVERLGVLIRALGPRTWNPCSAVETEGTLVKPVRKVKDGSRVFSDAESKRGSSRRYPCSAVETAETTHLKVIPRGTNSLPPPPPKNNKGSTGVFLDAESKRESRNLMELLARPEREIVRESLISRVRSLRDVGENRARNGTERMQRNHTVNVRFEHHKVLEGIQISDGRVRVQARDIL
ncbi:putative serine/threonine-protein kinase-like protein [Iris pallida]|uniref:Serine/threonine-protein kinase-like protein n=1 Tax=Iris pallida TaxID=29817 RepID=A0AAX6HCH9_IRIPA|nr:putative serine/threonine-protein kinase-like protein [Iris pallida]